MPLKEVFVFLTLGICQRNGDACALHFDKHYGGLFADCNGRKLQHVPQDLPANITALDISENDVTTMTKFTFLKLKNLTYLNLNMNPLSKLEPEAFAGLFSLTTLLLARNKLSNDKPSFPDEVFRDLVSLHTLNLEKTEMSSYPDWVFPPLVKLHSLYIDSVPHPLFGPGFSNLANLKVLQMDSRFIYGGECSTKTLKNETFQSLNETKLEVLVLNYCLDLEPPEYGVLQPLQSLKQLEFTNNEIGIQTSLHLLHPFVGRNMSKIWLNDTCTRRTQHKRDISSKILTEKSTHYLTQICVSEVSLTRNRIYLIEMTSIFKEPFLECLEVFDVSDNYLAGDAAIIVSMSHFSKLKYLGVSNQRQGRDFPTTDNYGMSNGNLTITLSLPPKLRHFGLSAVVGPRTVRTIQEINFLNTDSLETVLIGFNSIKGLLRLRGVEHVSSVDLSGNELGSVAIFNSFTNVKRLSLQSCNLQFPKESLGVSSVFSTLTSLEYLDISLNDIRYFRLLSVPANIIHINLSHNQFETVPIETFDYRSLNLIDISFNLIGQMDRDTRLKLDLSAEKNNLKLIIKGNTFSCSCRNLDFILWLVDTPVIYENDRNFPCILDNGTMTGTVDVAKQYESLYHYCTGKLILNLTITFSVVILTAIVATYTVSKNSVRYRNIVLRIFGLGIQYLTPKDFDFTFYVGYCETDIPFVYHKLRHGLELCSQPVRLFLKDRDVLPGVPIADGIICGITYSWKSVLVISDDFLQDCSQWSQFTIDAALYSVTDLIPNRIIVLLVGPVQVEDLPERLLNVVEEECILRVEDYQHGDVKLWKVLREIAKV